MLYGLDLFLSLANQFLSLSRILALHIHLRTIYLFKLYRSSEQANQSIFVGDDGEIEVSV
jgi:hypothetical protein